MIQVFKMLTLSRGCVTRDRPLIRTNHRSQSTTRDGRHRVVCSSAQGENRLAADMWMRGHQHATQSRRVQRQQAICDVVEVQSDLKSEENVDDTTENELPRVLDRLSELQAFYKEHGHSTPPSGTSLSNWVKRLRTQRRRGELSEDMILSLNALDLDWEPAETRMRKRVEELRAFKEREGHSQVPVGCALERWIRRVRTLKRKNKLPDYIVHELDELSMVWEPRKTRDQRSEEIFDTRMEELKALIAKDGKVRKTNQYDPGMRAWLYHQQRNFREGKLEKDKISALRDVGIVLKMTQRVSWDMRLVELIEFKRTHGHCNVPATWRHNKELGSWVGTQRKYMRMGRLSDERVAALTSIGFEWEPKKAVSRGMRSKASPWTVSGVMSEEDQPVVQISWIGGEDQKPPIAESFSWGRASENYEEKQQVVFEELETWWKEGLRERQSVLRSVRGMRLNHRVKVARNINVKPDILLEISSDIGGESLTWGLIVEVDEFGHRRGSKSYVNEESRMSDVQSALDVPVKFVRFNPDPTEGDPRELDERIGELLDHLKQAISQPPVRDLEVAYLAYD